MLFITSPGAVALEWFRTCIARVLAPFRARRPVATVPKAAYVAAKQAAYGATRNACFRAAYVAVQNAIDAAGPNEVPTPASIASAYVTAIASVVPHAPGKNWPGRANAMRAAIKAKAHCETGPETGDEINRIARALWKAGGAA